MIITCSTGPQGRAVLNNRCSQHDAWPHVRGDSSSLLLTHPIEELPTQQHPRLGLNLVRLLGLSLWLECLHFFTKIACLTFWMRTWFLSPCWERYGRDPALLDFLLQAHCSSNALLSVHCWLHSPAVLSLQWTSDTLLFLFGILSLQHPPILKFFLHHVLGSLLRWKCPTLHFLCVSFGFLSPFS